MIFSLYISYCILDAGYSYWTESVAITGNAKYTHYIDLIRIEAVEEEQTDKNNEKEEKRGKAEDLRSVDMDDDKNDITEQIDEGNDNNQAIIPEDEPFNENNIDLDYGTNEEKESETETDQMEEKPCKPNDDNNEEKPAYDESIGYNEHQTELEYDDSMGNSKQQADSDEEMPSVEKVVTERELEENKEEETAAIIED